MMSSDKQIPLDLGFRPAMGREDFLLSDCNQEAIAWVDKWPDWPFFSLMIYGSSACGKTHLTQVWQEKSQARVFNRDMLLSPDLEDEIPSSKAVIIDDLEAYLGNRDTEEALFHLYNMLKEQQGYLFLTTSQKQADMKFIIADLSSRIKSVPSVGIGAPDDILLAAVLVKMFSDRQVKVTHDVVMFVVSRMERSMENARKIVEAVDEVSLSRKRPVTIPLVKGVLDDLAL